MTLFRVTLRPPNRSFLFHTEESGKNKDVAKQKARLRVTKQLGQTMHSVKAEALPVYAHTIRRLA